MANRFRIHTHKHNWNHKRIINKFSMKFRTPTLYTLCRFVATFSQWIRILRMWRVRGKMKSSCFLIRVVIKGRRSRVGYIICMSFTNFKSLSLIRNISKFFTSNTSFQQHSFKSLFIYALVYVPLYTHVRILYPSNCLSENST